jgi:hypothetical protein
MFGNSNTIINGVKRIKADTTATASLRIDNDTTSATPTYSVLDHNSLDLHFGTSSSVGVATNGATGLQLNTNGTLTINGLTGFPGYFLKLDPVGNAVWDAVSQTLQSVTTAGAISTNTIQVQNSGGTTLSTLSPTGVQITTTTGGTKNTTIVTGGISFNGYTQPCGIKPNAITGLELTTGGSLVLEGLTGSAGQFLQLGVGGNAIWATASGGGTTIQSGETTAGDFTSSLTFAVTYGSSFPSKPKVILSYNTNGTSTIIPVALYSHTLVSTNYTGFTIQLASTTSTGTVSYYATV